MPSYEYSSSSSNRSGSAHADTSGAKPSSHGKAYKPSGSTTIPSSSPRKPSGSKTEIHYPSTYKDPDRRSKFQDSGYYP